MENCSIIEKKELKIKEGISMNQLNSTHLIVLNEYSKLKGNNINDSDILTLSLSTHKNSSDSSNRSLEKENPLSQRSKASRRLVKFDDIYMEESKKRKDIFGREIKKRGKHKVSFADELGIISSFIPTTIDERFSKRKVNFSSTKNLKQYLPIVESRKRANSFNSGRISMLKNIYNMTKIKTNLKKKFKKPYVDIINVENLKIENKLNTFSMKKIRELAEEENVSCSCYCSIW